jgi:hypothetical protein
MNLKPLDKDIIKDSSIDLGIINNKHRHIVRTSVVRSGLNNIKTDFNLIGNQWVKNSDGEFYQLPNPVSFSIVKMIVESTVTKVGKKQPYRISHLYDEYYLIISISGMKPVIKTLNINDLSKSVLDSFEVTHLLIHGKKIKYAGEAIYFDLPKLSIDDLNIQHNDIPEELQQFINSVKGLDLKTIKHKIALQYHPDLGGDINNFKLLINLLL